MSDKSHRTERDSMGELKVPADALWGAQTQRAVDNFPISGLAMPRQFIAALGLVKWAAAGANAELGLLTSDKAVAIQKVALEVADGIHDRHFPIDVFQTGSGTSSNMNANEVIARLASAELGAEVHPNDDVNMSQSSNDVIPTCVHLSAARSIHDALLPALRHLAKTLQKKSEECGSIVKTGRTHLMDAMPVTFGQDLPAMMWVAAIAPVVFSLGYVVGLPLYVFVYLKTHGQGWIMSGALSLSTLALVYLGFVKIMGVHLPVLPVGFS